jgi:hypothetical protein
MPELIDDIFAWRPTAYQDCFTRSILSGRGSALEAYAALSQTFRRDFEVIVEELDRMAVRAIAAIRRHYKTKSNTKPYTLAGLCTRSGEKMRSPRSRDEARELRSGYGRRGTAGGRRPADAGEPSASIRLFGGDPSGWERDILEVARAPITDRRDDRNKASAFGGQAIFHFGRDNTVILAVDEPAFGQRLQFAA